MSRQERIHVAGKVLFVLLDHDQNLILDIKRRAQEIAFHASVSPAEKITADEISEMLDPWTTHTPKEGGPI